MAARTIVEGSLSDHQVREVAEMARRVEKHYGLPQDVEWAISGEDLYALQAPPITGLPDVAPIEPHIEPPEEGFWFLDGGHYPKPMSPMAAFFYLDHIGKNSTTAFAELGGLIDGIENRPSSPGSTESRQSPPPDRPRRSSTTASWSPWTGRGAGSRSTTVEGTDPRGTERREGWPSSAGKTFTSSTDGSTTR